ncbi:MAG: DUF3520 domain-containing protein [Verrucomicrobiales bacterium]|nr:DUF3520 domain-containing protein [Verrucomicrobiales bacterium]MCP5557159.1 DUF3520 domain-containing protein [Verrucomicrobiaceae bacterium]
MNTPNPDHQDLTTFVLGELPPESGTQMDEQIHQTPEWQNAAAEISAVAEALRHGAPMHDYRLTAAQRQQVLQPTHLPRRVTPLQPRPIVQRRPSPWAQAGASLIRIAALVTLATGAFFLGRQFAPNHLMVPVTKITPQGSTEPTPVGPTPAPVQIAAVTPAPAPKLVAKKPQPQMAVAAAPSPPATQPPAKVIAASETPEKNVAKPAKLTADLAKLGFTSPAPASALINASRTAVDQVMIRPADIKPSPQKPKGAVFASPMQQNQPTTKADTSRQRNPELFIHSWSTDVYACPWNAERRLLRVVVQMPADQPAVRVDEATYPLSVSFDANNVRSFRLLCERQLPSADLRSSGTHTLWYEFVPNGAAPSGARTSGKLIATVTIPSLHFTTQTVGPFDDSHLQAFDKGEAWSKAREDFIFESSVVGLGLLLRGTPDLGNLNHELVMTLAQQGKGKDVQGDRARFIHFVKEAQRVSGL